jgi:hypothetical protein
MMDKLDFALAILILGLHGRRQKMKSYIKTIKEDYIIDIQTINIPDIGNITKEEYDEILEIAQNKPVSREGYDYRLKTDLTWEEYQLPIYEEDETE